MYFSENLEICTIEWVSFCEGGVGVGKESAFFILVGGDGTHRPHPGLRPYSPRVTPAHFERLHGTGSRADRAGTIETAASAGACSACMLRMQRFYMLVRLILNMLLTCTFNHV